MGSLPSAVPPPHTPRARKELLAVQKAALLPLVRALVQYTTVCKVCAVEPLVQEAQWAPFMRPGWLPAGGGGVTDGRGGETPPAAKRPRT